MAQENAPNKPVHIMFFCGAIVAFYLTQWSIDWIWGYFVRTPDEFLVTVGSGLFAVLGAVVLYRSDRVYHHANEIASELGKVTWPTAKEVRAATLVVVAMTLISALILGIFDLVWSQLTEVVYG